MRVGIVQDAFRRARGIHFNMRSERGVQNASAHCSECVSALFRMRWRFVQTGKEFSLSRSALFQTRSYTVQNTFQRARARVIMRTHMPEYATTRA
eukprot:241759-Lingulodinium_polyedra.AAC.1